MNKEWGYTYSSGEKYSGQAFCDDGLFMADPNANLQKISEVVSAFCELYKVKKNAVKSYYMISQVCSIKSFFLWTNYLLPFFEHSRTVQALGAVLFAVVRQIKDFYFEKIDGKRDIENLTWHDERLATKDGWISTDGHKSYSRFGFEVRPDMDHPPRL